MTNLGETNDSL